MPTTVLKHIKGNKLADFLKRKINVEPDCIYTIKFDLIKETPPIKEEVIKETPQQDISQVKKGKWAKIAERIENESYLKGFSEEVVKDIQEFKNSFSI